jgi:urea carboxylase
MEFRLVQGEPAAGKPAATYRMAGDSYILAEYGDMEFDLLLNFHVQAVDQHLRGQRLPGVVETSPAFRSILVYYEPDDVAAREVIDFLEAANHAVAPMEASIIQARVITLPIAFDDSATREAIARYTKSVRADAPNTEGGTNVDYVVRYNGLRDREELFKTFVGSDWWTAFVGSQVQPHEDLDSGGRNRAGWAMCDHLPSGVARWIPATGAHAANPGFRRQKRNLPGRAFAR